MTIGKKITLACSALVALTIILGTVAILNFGQMNTQMESIREYTLPGIQAVGVISGMAKEQNVTMLERIIADSLPEMARLESKLLDQESRFQAALKSYPKTSQSEGSSQLFDRLAPLHERVNAVWA